ncbi:hypothetical protein SLS62_009631 [Diatrype stigma]|uniref:Uncharacterized protein n=1 Tax=Diatrype stigma TaxID=117547 RepID=A0AAN9UFX8_9PEZI
MESEQDVPNNNLRHDSPQGLRRMSSLFKRIMRKEDASANSNKSNKSTRVEQLQRDLQNEAEYTDSDLKNNSPPWLRRDSGISGSSMTDGRRGSGSSRASCSTVFSRERYSYGSTATNSTWARRSSCLSYAASTVRAPCSGASSIAVDNPAVNENTLCDSDAGRGGPQDTSELEDHQPAPCPWLCSDPVCAHTSPDPFPGGPERSLEDLPTTRKALQDLAHGDLPPRPRRPSSSAEVGHPQPYLRVAPPMHEPLRDTSSFWTASSRSTHVTEYDSATASEYEDDLLEEPHVLAPLTGLLLEKLLGVFYNDDISRSSASYTSHGTPESPSTQSSQGRQSGETSSSHDDHHHHRVRHRGGAMGRHNHDEANDSEGEEEGGEDRPPKRIRKMPSDMTNQQLLACPFCKWKPLTYQRCYKYVLKDISRVKQHLRRSHRRPPYCPKCWQVFGDENGRDVHIRAESCLALDAAGTPASASALEGITSAQQEQLERRVDKKLSRADQWYSMYAVLFPDCPRPESPYVESDLSAELLSFQQFMGTVGLGIVEQTARDHVTPALRPQQDQLVEFSQILFQHAIPRILQHYEATRPNAAATTTIATTADSSSADSGYGSMRSGIGGGDSGGGGRVSRESERPREIDRRHVLRPQGQRSIHPVHHEAMPPSSFMFGAAATGNTDSRYQMFEGFPPGDVFSPGLPGDELVDFDMGNMHLGNMHDIWPLRN